MPLDTTVHIGTQMIDITTPQIVEIQIDSDREIVWINIDGVCRLRACGVQKMHHRRHE